MAKYLIHNEHLHVLILSKKEVSEIISLLAKQLADVGSGACPEVYLEKNGAKLSFILGKD